MTGTLTLLVCISDFPQFLLNFLSDIQSFETMDKLFLIKLKLKSAHHSKSE